MIKFNDFPNSDEKGMSPVEIVFRRTVPDKSIISLLIPPLSNINKALSTAVRCTVRFGLICACSSKKQIERYKNNKNLALLTTYIQSHETQCILRAIDSIKELFPGYQEGERLVPVPMQDIGCEVGLHGGKWEEVPNIKERIKLH